MSRDPVLLLGTQETTWLQRATRRAWRAVWRWLWRLARRGGRWAARRAWTHRRLLAPFYLAAGVWLAGATLWLTPDGPRTALALAAMGTLCGALWWWPQLLGPLRRRVRGPRRWGRRRQAYAVAVYATCWAALLYTSHAGPGPPVPGLLLWAAVGYGVFWWWWHRRRPVPPEPPARVRWDATLAVDGGALAGSVIDAPRELVYQPPAPPCRRCAGHGVLLEAEDGEIDLQLEANSCPDCGGAGHREAPASQVVGWEAAGSLPPAKLTTKHAIEAVPAIASAFGVPLPSVAVEGPPDGRYDRFVVRIYRRNPLQDMHYWPGPASFDPDTGVAHIGLYGDMQPVPYRFFEPGSGPWHDLISGTTGVGKSTLLNILLAYERANPTLFASVVIDPQNGASLPYWQGQVAHYARTAEEGVEVLLRLEQLMHQRNEVLGNLQWRDELGRKITGVGFFDPHFPPIAALGLPIVSVTIDEAHAVLAYDEGIRAAEAMGKMIRKCGGRLRLVTQMPLVSELNGSSVLKEMVASGNNIVMRTATRLAGDVAFSGALPVDPVSLPREWPDGTPTKGLCFVAGPQARSVPARIYHPGDVYHWSHRGRTVALELPPPPERDAAPPVAGVEPSAADVTDEGGDARELVVAYLRRRGAESPARTSVIAHQIGRPASTVGDALERARQAGQVQRIARGLWVAADG